MIVSPVMTMLYTYVGDDLMIECAVSSKPAAVIQWSRQITGENDTVFDSDSTTKGANSLVLMIMNATMNDAGMYTCSAWIEGHRETTAVNKTVEVMTEGKSM